MDNIDTFTVVKIGDLSFPVLKVDENTMAVDIKIRVKENNYEDLYKAINVIVKRHEGIENFYIEEV